MLKTRILVASLAGLALIACDADLTVPDFNNEALDNLRDNPTATSVGAAATGLLVSGRDEFDDRNGYVSLLGILGRESYNFDGSDPRFITEMLGGSLSPSSPAFGGNLWGERYSNIRTGEIILEALPKVPEAQLSEEERAAVRGFVKTMQAHELLLTVNAHDANGAVIDFDTEPTGSPGALATKDQALGKVESLLDDARDDLDAAGSADFPFPLTTGFTGFDTPATFREFNRGLAARVALYRDDPQGALDDLGESFIDEGASLDRGVYHVFGTTPGDEPNDLFDPGDSPDILAHPSLETNVEMQGNGQPDRRFQNKVRKLAESRTRLDVTTDLAFTIYDAIDAPIPIIRNEELILIRAEARFRTNQLGLAIDDINFIRTESGGLDERTDLDATNFEDELLQQRRYSLMFEGGHRWIDTRRMGRIEDLPLDLPEHQRNTAFPIPEAECLARGQQTCSAGG